MVVISAPSAWTAKKVQDFTPCPSTSTVHAPQLLVSQPTWVPVRPASSRMYCTSNSRGSTSCSCLAPLMVTASLRLIRTSYLRAEPAANRYSTRIRECLARRSEPVETDRRSAEYFLGGGGAKAIECCAHGVQNLAVIGGQETDRPIRAEEASVRPEPVEHLVDVGGEVLRLPPCPIRLGHHPGQLATHVHQLAKRRHRPRPGLGSPPVSNRRFGDVVDDKAHAGRSARGFERRGEFPRPDQEVVGQSRSADGCEPTLHVVAKQPCRVGVVVHLVANADQLGAARHGLELGNGLRRVSVPEVDPTDYPGEEVRHRRGREQLASFVEVRAGLDDDGTSHPVAAQLRFEIRGSEGTVDLRKVIGHPGIRGAGGVPEVVVRVDNHGRLGDGTGAASWSKPFACSAGQSAGGSASSKSMMFSWSSARDRQPVRTQTTAGWARGNCRAAAFTGTLKRAHTASIRIARSTISG